MRVLAAATHLSPLKLKWQLGNIKIEKERKEKIVNFSDVDHLGARHLRSDWD